MQLTVKFELTAAILLSSGTDDCCDRGESVPRHCIATRKATVGARTPPDVMQPTALRSMACEAAADMTAQR